MDATELFAPLGPGYDRWGTVLSFGQDPRWRRFLVSRIDAGPTDTVLDVATGTAAVALELVRQKDCFVVGVDLTPGMLDEGRRRVALAAASQKIRLQEGDARSLPFDGRPVRRAHVHLPAPLRRRSARGPARARTRRQAGRDDRRARVRRAERRLAAVVGGLDTRRPPGRRAADRRRLARGGHVPQPVDPRASTSAGRCRACAAAWREAGIDDVETRRLSLGGGVVTWGRRRA